MGCTADLCLPSEGFTAQSHIVKERFGLSMPHSYGTMRNVSILYLSISATWVIGTISAFRISTPSSVGRKLTVR